MGCCTAECEDAGGGAVSGFGSVNGGLLCGDKNKEVTVAGNKLGAVNFLQEQWVGAVAVAEP